MSQVAVAANTGAWYLTADHQWGHYVTGVLQIDTHICTSHNNK